MSQNPVILELNNNVANIIFNKPEKHHAFDEEFIKTFTEIIHEIEKNESVKLCIITSSGKSFCAGADLNWMKRMATFSEEENYADALKLDSLMYSLADLNIPTVAVIQGNCFGGALGILACCDIVITSDIAKFCFSEAKLGLAPAVISSYVVRAIGTRNAQKYFITAEVFNAYQAKNMNLCHEVIEHNKLEDRKKELINQLLNNSNNALKNINEITKYLSPLPSIETRKYLSKAISRIRASDEAQEGMKAFFEKSKPSWTES
jgi:methylglutaconyl-CoA hydratase